MAWSECVRIILFLSVATLLSSLLNCELVLSVSMNKRRTRITGTAQIVGEASFAAVDPSFNNFTLARVAVHDQCMSDVCFVGIRNYRTAEQEDAFFWLVV